MWNTPNQTIENRSEEAQKLIPRGRVSYFHVYWIKHESKKKITTSVKLSRIMSSFTTTHTDENRRDIMLSSRSSNQYNMIFYQLTILIPPSSKEHWPHPLRKWIAMQRTVRENLLSCFLPIDGNERNEYRHKVSHGSSNKL